ncbi:MAG: helix-turn-helix transcriptional regulator [Syntrophomonadaceae bacterium]|nr:helix-turn-helix transcriptional regulator [Syntrophomonadaceae bacterium]
MKSRVECNRLKGLLVERKLTQQKIASIAGISENSLARKINGHRDLWYWEMAFITKQLGFQAIHEVFPEICKSCGMTG